MSWGRSVPDTSMTRRPRCCKALTVAGASARRASAATSTPRSSDPAATWISVCAVCPATSSSSGACSCPHRDRECSCPAAPPLLMQQLHHGNVETLMDFKVTAQACNRALTARRLDHKGRPKDHMRGLDPSCWTFQQSRRHTLFLGPEDSAHSAIRPGMWQAQRRVGAPCGMWLLARAAAGVGGMQLATQSALPTATCCPPTVADTPLPGWLTRLPASTSRVGAPAPQLKLALGSGAGHRLPGKLCGRVCAQASAGPVSVRGAVQAACGMRALTGPHAWQNIWAKHTGAHMPRPPSTGRHGSPPADDAAASTAAASGCVDWRSSAAAYASSRAAAASRSGPAAWERPCTATDWMAGLPTVKVPVLSKATTSTCAAASSTSPPRMSKPLQHAPGFSLPVLFSYHPSTA